MKPRLYNKHIKKIQPIMSPIELFVQVPGDKDHGKRIISQREAVAKIIHRSDNRLIIMAGPCSIHDTDEAVEYASKLKDLSNKVQDKFMIVMRVYFEKPRTITGWKGLICDPNIDGSDEFANGLLTARRLMDCISRMELPIVTEFLDPLIPQYIGDYVATGTIGARTIESQTHRQMASGLSMPIGFKNSTTGSAAFALDAIQSAEAEHSFIGIDVEGLASLVSTTGNRDGYLILRGGKTPNYDQVYIDETIQLLNQRNMRSSIVVDCSHGNSFKDFRNQRIAFSSVIKQRIDGNKRIVGLMLESNLYEGNQLPTHKPFKRGVSITDSCIGFTETERLILTAYDML